MTPDLYTAHAATIEAALAQAGRMHRLAPDAAEEFRSWARLRLLDHDQAILRKFAGRSSLRTFLITVVQRLYLDWRNAEWGKWRPTAEARRLGPVAIELERLVGRDQLTYGEAAQTLAARGVASLAECDTAWRRLPRRPARRRVDEAQLDGVSSPSRASDLVDAAECHDEAAALARALDRAIATLSPRDQVLLNLRYWGGHTVARIAAVTGDDQKALYRRFDRIVARLHAALLDQGIEAARVHELTGRLDGAPQRALAPQSAETGEAGPSRQTSSVGDHD